HGQSRAAAVDPRWTPWLGCWQTDTTQAKTAAATSFSCIVPLRGSSGVQVLTVTNGKIAARQRLEVDGRDHPMSDAGCAGTRTGEWSFTGHRVYLRAAFTCDIGLSGKSTTLYAISPAGEWLEIE